MSAFRYHNNASSSSSRSPSSSPSRSHLPPAQRSLSGCAALQCFLPSLRRTIKLRPEAGKLSKQQPRCCSIRLVRDEQLRPGQPCQALHPAGVPTRA